MDVVVDYTAPPTVSAMMRSDARVRCIMGPVGSGKSSGCVTEIFRRALAQKPGPDGIRRTRWAVIRNTYGQLNDTTRKTFSQWIPTQLGTWNEARFTFTMKFKDVHAEVLFRPLDRPEDVSKLLSLELTGAYINEGRELPKDVLDNLQSRVGRFPAQKDGGPTWHGIWMDTNPWHTGHWLHKLEQNPPKGFSFFRQPGGREEDAENIEFLPPGYYEELCAGKDAEWIAVYVDGQVASSDFGSVYGKSLDLVRDRGGVSDFGFTTEDVFTSWDLGIGDSTAIWFWQLNQNGADFIDHYENHGQGISHYFEVLERKAIDKGYRYARHWLPHDARAKTLQTGVSTLDLFLENPRIGPSRVAITPSLSIADGLGAARWLMEQSGTRFHATHCRPGIEALQQYRYKYNLQTQAFAKTPLHDWSSNSSDAFRYAALVVKATADLRPKPKPEPVRFVTHYPVTMDELWALNEEQGAP